MPEETKMAIEQAKSETQTSTTLRQFIQEPGSSTSNQRDCSSPEETHCKMGFVFSKMSERFSPKTFTTHDSTDTRVPMRSCDDMMAPELGEIPSRPGSSCSLTSAASNDVEHQSSLLWPYVSSRADHDGPESEHPLRLRRPALYEEYWAHETRTNSRWKR